MPLYEYECKDCTKVHEFIQKFSDPPKTKCPSCGGELRKLISNTSFVLKGSGWYADGYSSTSGSNTVEVGGKGGGSKSSKGKKAEAKKDAPAAPTKTEKASGD